MSWGVPPVLFPLFLLIDNCCLCIFFLQSRKPCVQSHKMHSGKLSKGLREKIFWKQNATSNHLWLFLPSLVNPVLPIQYTFLRNGLSAAAAGAGARENCGRTPEPFYFARPGGIIWKTKASWWVNPEVNFGGEHFCGSHIY